MTAETLVGALPGTVMKYVRVLTSASLTSRSGLAPGKGVRWRRGPFTSGRCLGAGEAKQRKAAGTQVENAGFASVTPQGRSGTRLGVRSADRHGSAVKVRREHRWNATFGFT